MQNASLHPITPALLSARGGRAAGLRTTRFHNHPADFAEAPTPRRHRYWKTGPDFSHRPIASAGSPLTRLPLLAMPSGTAVIALHLEFWTSLISGTLADRSRGHEVGVCCSVYGLLAQRWD